MSGTTMPQTVRLVSCSLLPGFRHTCPLHQCTGVGQGTIVSLQRKGTDGLARHSPPNLNHQSSPSLKQTQRERDSQENRVIETKRDSQRRVIDRQRDKDQTDRDRDRLGKVEGKEKYPNLLTLKSVLTKELSFFPEFDHFTPTAYQNKKSPCCKRNQKTTLVTVRRFGKDCLLSTCLKPRATLEGDI